MMELKSLDTVFSLNIGRSSSKRAVVQSMLTKDGWGKSRDSWLNFGVP
jgi:hypothetical protein